MCGIFGNFVFSGEQRNQACFQRMAQSLRHRGPDAAGFECNSRAALGNTRLSIVDLSEASNQPLYSPDKRYTLVQNGEIYNFPELRSELERSGAKFLTQGDTEVLLHAFLFWGEGFVTRLNGMFAIAIFDKQTETLWLFRDRLGVKPLFYTRDERQLYFASEIKGLLSLGLTVKPNLSGLASMFMLNYTPPALTCFEGVEQVQPGHFLRVSKSGVVQKQYWSLSCVDSIPDMTESEAKSEFLKLLDDSTRIRMRADAPFGAFLSGGLDSSSVVGFMSLYQEDPVQTYSIGFEDPRFDETKYAQMAAKRFGTQHKVSYLQPDIETMWNRFVWHTEQPHGDVSFIPTDAVAKLAAQDVKMVLTGDGGDELFAGYTKYLDYFDSHKELRPAQYAEITGLVGQQGATGLFTDSFLEVFRSLPNPMQVALEESAVKDPINRVLAAEIELLLPGNNLVKPDRMAMANSLEVRSPFLDYRLVEYAQKVPGRLKLKDRQTKAIFKKAIEPFLGPELTYRKKQMFTVPVGEWFKGSLKKYCEDTLLDGRAFTRGIYRPQVLESIIAEHFTETKNHTRLIRAMISTELWHRQFIDHDESMKI
jgi:asparagine synthase (glutamine-hydrolysing)